MTAGRLYLLDTNILMHLVRDQALGRYLRATYVTPSQPQELWVCTVSLGEIWSLAARRNWGPRKRQELTNLLARMDILDIGHALVVAAYVDVDRASRAHFRGARQLGQNDLWIAAVAQVTGIHLLTTDKDFDHLHPAELQRIYIDPASALPPPPGTTP